jgi:cation diffusion facilitator family transporter
MVLFAARHSNQAADDDHPYGHGRIETVFTVGLGAVLMLTGLGIIFDAGQRLIEPESLLQPSAIALAVAILSILIKEAMYHYTFFVGKRVNSNLLKANAWHHRTDAISSVIVLIGIGGTLLGFAALDALAAVGVAVMIISIGWRQGLKAIEELIDTGLAPDRVAAIQTAMAEVEGVHNPHRLRTRRMGDKAMGDVHVQVNPRLSVSEGHQIAEYVRARVINTIDEVSDVTVHIDPEDDEKVCFDLPLRQTVLRDLKTRWHTLIDSTHIKAVNLHYLEGKIDLEVILPLDRVDNAQAARDLTEQLRSAIANCAYLRSVRIYFG